MPIFRTNEKHINLRLDQFLNQMLIAPPSMNDLRRQIEKGSCQIGGKIQFKASYKIKEGDSIDYTEKTIQEIPLIRVIWSDDHFVGIEKPHGLTLSNTQDLQNSTHHLDFDELHLIHRLDKDTSGVLLCATSKEALSKGMKLFRQHKCQKTYLALIQGKWKKEHGRIETRHGKKRIKGRQLWAAMPEGQEAITDYKILKTNGKVSLVEFKPLTGRTHQLRVHASEGDHPILGDRLYGKNLRIASTGRLMLHAHRLEFPHPFLEKQISIESKLPKEFESFI